MWRAFVEARDAGLARAIGVSNYTLDQVDELSRETGVTPAVNQVEWSPLLFDRRCSTGTASAASSSRATAPCAAAPSTTR